VRNKLKRLARSSALGLAGLALILTGPFTGSLSAASESDLQHYFREASAEFQVPEEILLGFSYNQTRWEDHDGEPSVSGGYGVMHLHGSFNGEDGRGDPSRPLQVKTEANKTFGLDEAARLAGAASAEVQTDERQNIRGGAALLAKYAKDGNGGKVPDSLNEWYGAIGKASGLSDDKSQVFADDVYATINSGVSVTTSEGQRVALKARSTTPDKSKLEAPETLQLLRGSNEGQPECPASLSCKFVPARYAQNNPDNVADYGNLDPADRPKDMKIKYIVVHDTEGSYQSAIDWFQDPRSYVSAHYVIRSSDGEVTQMVQNKDVAWHAGNWYMNMHSIGVEHEGFAAEGSTWYTEAMYRSSAKLVRYLSSKYDIPLDREHIVGHEQYHGLTPARAKLMHNDPGPFWDWEHYMDLLRAEPLRGDHGRTNAVTIAPRFKGNKQVVSKCVSGTCADLPKQSTNFVFLRTAPNTTAPLLTDTGLHPGGEPGTTEINDWSAVASYGQRFAVAERKGEWTAIWFGGQKGWFHNPESWRNKTAVPDKARVVTPKEGKASVPVYGRPLPEAAAFTASGVPLLNPVPLQYNLLAGQSYVAYDKTAINDYYHVLTFDSSTAGEGEIVMGNEKYIPISYNHRQAFVKASDVNVSW
jgi:N-acetyl-anhydromuramyl-L-alanine amidase AmpD